MPVQKGAEQLHPAPAHDLSTMDEGRRSPVSLNERTNIAHMGTLVRGGRARGVVVAGAKDSELGVVFRMMEDVDDTKTPLQVPV